MYQIPETLGAALELLDQDTWKILSGGTDFYPSAAGQPIAANILDVSRINGLRSIETEADGTISIGALCTWTELIKADLPAAFDGLKLAAREVGSIQIQNRATVAGNLCNASPAADGVPPLLTLDAKVRLQSCYNFRDVDLKDFILGNRRTCLEPNEMVTEIRIPWHSTKGKSNFVKLGARKYLVISISMVAARISVNVDKVIDAAAISVGACSEVAKRLTKLEATLVGKHLNSLSAVDIDGSFLSELSPIDDVRATRDYRLDATRELIFRTVSGIAEAGK